jgi:VIT1/CCC1 family predicted Fe2+/Mn2+ transporter
MTTDYTTAIVAVIGLVVLLTGMTAYMLTRPSDLKPTNTR